jgi:RNA-directed DNA polymerase
MSEDALVNTGAVEWPHPDAAYFAVRRMQTKLHRWAAGDPRRRFGDLFNLVYDPAFLVHAWERVATNKGAKTQCRLAEIDHAASDSGPRLTSLIVAGP